MPRLHLLVDVRPVLCLPGVLHPIYVADNPHGLLYVTTFQGPEQWLAPSVPSRDHFLLVAFCTLLGACCIQHLLVECTFETGGRAQQKIIDGIQTSRGGESNKPSGWKQGQYRWGRCKPTGTRHNKWAQRTCEWEEVHELPQLGALMSNYCMMALFKNSEWRSTFKNLLNGHFKL